MSKFEEIKQEVGAEDDIERLQRWKENPKALSKTGYENFRRKETAGFIESMDPKKVVVLEMAADMFKEANQDLANEINEKIDTEGRRTMDDETDTESGNIEELLIEIGY